MGWIVKDKKNENGTVKITGQRRRARRRKKTKGKDRKKPAFLPQHQCLHVCSNKTPKDFLFQTGDHLLNRKRN